MNEDASTQDSLSGLWQRFSARMQPTVFLGSAGVVVAFVVLGTVFTDTAQAVFEAVQIYLVGNLGWFYILTASVLLVFVLWLSLSRFGHVRLGGDDAEPEFGYFSWFSMMMSAGMGIGIIFFGVAEPLEHYANPPDVSPGADPYTPQAMREAMRYTFYHWGLHTWAIYSAIALPLAYFHFRHDLPLAPRSLLYPLIGERIYGPIGHGVDILCTVGTLFGVATSLGLGAMQINSGLSEVFGMPTGTAWQVLLIAGITAMAVVSVVSGVHRGIRWLSQANLGLGALVLLFVFVVGPTIFLLELFVSSIGFYLESFPFTSLWVNPGENRGWQANWTLFYWSWWISWSPFVGVFTARISKGRTIREFVLTALLVPTLLSFLWFTALGGTGLYFDIYQAMDLASEVRGNEETSLFMLLGQLPWSTLMSVVVTILIVNFFITSSDSGSLVDDMVTSGGHPNPPRVQRVFWALAEGAVAGTLLLAGGLQALRTAALTTGLPMAVFLLVAAYALFRGLGSETLAAAPTSRLQRHEARESTDNRSR